MNTNCTFIFIFISVSKWLHFSNTEDEKGHINRVICVRGPKYLIMSLICGVKTNMAVSVTKPNTDVPIKTGPSVKNL